MTPLKVSVPVTRPSMDQFNHRNEMKLIDDLRLEVIALQQRVNELTALFDLLALATAKSAAIAEAKVSHNETPVTADIPGQLVMTEISVPVDTKPKKTASK